MGSNLPFLVARRRNEHRLHGAAFLASLAGKLDIPSDQLSLIAPDRSVALEAGVYSHLKSGISLGEVARHCHLYLPEALSRFKKAIDAIGTADVNVLLCNSPEFSFSCAASVVATGIQALLELDGDTVTVVVDDNSAGVAIDVETEARDPQLYEVDQWGYLLEPT